jgi:hypothetical protein
MKNYVELVKNQVRGIGGVAWPDAITLVPVVEATGHSSQYSKTGLPGVSRSRFNSVLPVRSSC